MKKIEFDFMNGYKKDRKLPCLSVKMMECAFQGDNSCNPIFLRMVFIEVRSILVDF